MDPLSTLSVVSAAVQLVDFACKLVCKSKELYSSVDGLGGEELGAVSAARRLRVITESLRRSSLTYAAGQSGVARGQAGTTRLSNICNECDVISSEIQNKLRLLCVPDSTSHRRWKSFRQALKTVWSKKGLDAMAQELARLRTEIDTEVLLSIRETVQNLAFDEGNRFSRLDQQSMGILHAIKDSQSASETEFIKRFDSWEKNSRLEFAQLGRDIIRQHESFATFDTMVQKRLDDLIISQSKTRNEISAQLDVLQTNLNQVIGPQAQIKMERERFKFINETMELQSTKVYLNILDSLRFPEMRDRFESISNAHKNTFEWIFSTDPSITWDSFANWLSHGDGVYWIQGKPASGKSTLMSFIWQHEETKRCLQQWSEGSDIVAASFFFWNSGTALPSSEAGFLRSLLYDVLNHQPDLMSHLFPEEWERKAKLAANDFSIPTETWSSIGHLRSAFSRLTSLKQKNLKLCFFIDGLDEYRGDQGPLAEFINEISRKCSNIKFCVSSRPWSEFSCIFEQAATLRVQELTARDIGIYIYDNLEASKEMQTLIKFEQDHARWLVQEITNRAEGVFLWVCLVVRSLISGLRDGDDIACLHQRLDAMPVDLENLFEHIIDHQIQPIHKSEMSKIIQMFRANGNQLDILTLYRLLACLEGEAAIRMPIKLINTIGTAAENERLAWEMSRVKLRLLSRCKGLLEISQPMQPGHSSGAISGLNTEYSLVNPTATSWSLNRSGEKISHTAAEIPPPSKATFRRRLPFRARSRLGNGFGNRREASVLNDLNSSNMLEIDVLAPPTIPELPSEWKKSASIQYLHRTVRDFVEQPRIWTKLLNHTANSSFEPQLSLIASIIMQLKQEPVTSFNIGEVALHLASKIANYRIKVSERVIDLLQELDRVTHKRWIELGLGSVLDEKKNFFAFFRNEKSVVHGQNISSLVMGWGILWLSRGYGVPGSLTKGSSAIPFTTSSTSKSLSLFTTFLYALAFESDLRPSGNENLPQTGWPQDPAGLRAQEHQDEVPAFRTPNVELIRYLVSYGTNPNENVGQFTIWEFVIHLVHLLSEDPTIDMGPWADIFIDMLEHGADPHACCIHQPALSSSKWSSPALRNMISAFVNHGSESNLTPRPPTVVGPVRRGCDDERWDPANLHPYYHSASAVISDVFEGRGIPTVGSLRALIQDKKRTKKVQIRDRVKHSAPDTKKDPPWPDWTS